MRRVLNLCLVGFASVVSVCWTMDMAASCIASLNPVLRARTAQLNCLHAEINAFGTHLDSLVAAVAHDRLSLCAASQSLEEYAADHYPTYFTSLAVVEPDRPLRAKLARMLLTQLELDMKDGKDGRIDPERHRQLISECNAIES